MAEITCEHVRLGYDNHDLVEDLTFQVNKGDYLCIVGENGAGKSTLMRTILGLQKPLSGEIRFGDGLTSTQIGYLPQQTVVQKDFPASVREVVLSGRQGHLGKRFFYSREDKRIAEEQMERLEILPLANRSYRELSGGQQQRVLLARALCATERIILLDEPVSGLDPRATEEMYRTVGGLNKQGVTVIMITHDVRDALDHASHILHISERWFYGTREAYLASELGAGFVGKEVSRA